MDVMSIGHYNEIGQVHRRAVRMNGNLSQELVAARMADLQREADRSLLVPSRASRPVRRSLGHALVVLGSRLEGCPQQAPLGLR